MRVGKAKRRVLKWKRYRENTETFCNRKWYPVYHAGHVKAFSDYTNANRYYPIGVRDVRFF